MTRIVRVANYVPTIDAWVLYERVGAESTVRERVTQDELEERVRLFGAEELAQFRAAAS